MHAVASAAAAAAAWRRDDDVYKIMMYEVIKTT